MEIEVTQILLQILNFGVLAIVLAKFLFKPILDILDARRSKIDSGLKAAEKSLRDQEAMQEKLAAELKKADQKAAKILAEARDEGKKLSAQLLAEARAEAAKQLDKQKASFMASLAEEEKALKGRVADLVVETTTKVLGNALKSADLKKITKQALTDLK